MAAGLIMVAHRSGGPLMDIVVESEGSQNGFLAADENEYAQAFASILQLSPHTRRVIQDAARYVKSQYCNYVLPKTFMYSRAPVSADSVSAVYCSPQKNLEN
jgi:alpha-1,2-mannosyltransferase